MGLGLSEIVIIVIAIAILLFGGKKVTELSRSMGRASGEFKKAKREVERELKAEEQTHITDAQVVEPSDKQVK
jgi:sec-independent protein translocase protein TatA